MMQLEIRRFITAKNGNQEAECEDAFAENAEEASKFFAVADGATTSAFSAYWATLLVNAYAGGCLSNGSFVSCLKELQKTWWEHVSARAHTWFVKEKIQEGSHATLVGLSLQDSSEGCQSGQWQAAAIGDSCLFHIRGDTLLNALPLSSASEFSNVPYLLSSMVPPEKMEPDVKHFEGEWIPGDIFLLMTDAISCWFLSHWPMSFNLLEKTKDDSDLLMLIEQLRADCDLDGVPIMRNDDVTMLRIAVL